MSFFWGGHWYPCFGFLVTSPLGFKASVGSALFAFCGGECNVHSPRSTSGATRAYLLAASITATPVPTSLVNNLLFSLLLFQLLVYAPRTTV